jgi:hypothetical protein
MLHTSARFWNRLYRAEWSGRRRMGLWGVLWEIFKVVVPHTAPHVARAVRGRQTAGIAERRAQAAAIEIAQGIATMEERLAAAEEKAAAAESSAAAAEERAAAAEDRLALAQTQWNAVRKWMLALVVWNAALTAILIYVLMARR